MDHRKLDYRRLIRTSPLQNKDGVLTPRRLFSLPGVEIKVSIPFEPGESETVNQKELVREMREMHEEQMALQKEVLAALQKLAESGLVIHGSPVIMNEPRRGQHASSANLNAPIGVEMDESVFVTEVDTSGIKKGFDELAEIKSEKDSKLKSNLSKLRALKKGD